MTLTDTSGARAEGRWTEPDGVRARGTVLVFPGRGETASAYWRFGARIAADAYRVVAASPATAAAELADAVRPVVALGADTGAIEAVAFAAAHDVDAVVVAGAAVGGEADELVADLSTRSACPAHLAVLEADDTVSRTRDSFLGAIDLAPRIAPASVPVLAIHGSADPVSPLPEALELYRAWNATQVTVIEGGLHDVLSDVSHRTVAATVVIFLERLRAGADLPAIARDLAPEAAR